MKLSKIWLAGFMLTYGVNATDIEQDHIHVDGNDVERHLALKPSEGTESYAWLMENNRGLKLNVLSAEELPTTIDHRDLCSDVWDQGKLGSCTGFASKSAAELVWNVLTPDQKGKFIGSALFQYYNERVLEQTVEEDSGATISDAIKAMMIYGLAPDEDWNYEGYQEKYRLKPSEKAYEDAKEHKDLDKYAQAYIGNDPLAIKSALFHKHGVIIGVAVYKSFMSPEVAKSGMVPVPNTFMEDQIGGHALHVVGYDDTNKWYIVKNSWSAKWGDQGYCYLPYKYVHNKNLAFEVWSVAKMGAELSSSSASSSSQYGWYNPLRWMGY